VLLKGIGPEVRASETTLSSRRLEHRRSFDQKAAAPAAASTVNAHKGLRVAPALRMSVTALVGVVMPVDSGSPCVASALLILVLRASPEPSVSNKAVMPDSSLARICARCHYKSQGAQWGGKQGQADLPRQGLCAGTGKRYL